MGNAWLKLGRFSQAHHHYKKVLLLNPGDPLNGYCVSALRSSGWKPESKNAGTTSPTNAGSGNGVTGLVVDGNTIKEVVPDLPAAKAGIRAGDKIVTIDGKNTYGMDSKAIARLITGKPDTTVSIIVDRAGLRSTHSIVRQSPPEDYKKRMTASSGSTTSSTQATSSSSDLDPQDKALITIHKRTNNTDYIYNQVAMGIKQLPSTVKDELRQHGCSILIAPTIVDARPELRNTKPEGYLHGGGYDNCPGMFSSDTKTLYIAETASWRNNPPQLNRWALPTTLHE
ncbi:MAG: PDZ domain-containing protein, partial [Candidatus Obscuribacterales bacterium]|nr:PDZ domain-containing protein [Candidatus Obscuribacterales bacterium]